MFLFLGEAQVYESSLKILKFFDHYFRWVPKRNNWLGRFLSDFFFFFAVEANFGLFNDFMPEMSLLGNVIKNTL